MLTNRTESRRPYYNEGETPAKLAELGIYVELVTVRGDWVNGNVSSNYADVSLQAFDIDGELIAHASHPAELMNQLRPLFY